MLPQKLLLKERWNMIRTPDVITMGIIMVKDMSAGTIMGIIMAKTMSVGTIMEKVIIMVMKAATVITVKDMSADITMAKGSTAVMRRETKDAVVATANKRVV